MDQPRQREEKVRRRKKWQACNLQCWCGEQQSAHVAQKTRRLGGKEAAQAGGDR